MASKMAVIFKEYYLCVRTSSEQAEIFRIGPEKLVEQHTKSPGESPWSFPRNPRWRPKWPSFSKNITCMLGLALIKAEISTIGPQKSVKQHTKSPGKSLWSFSRNSRWHTKWTSFSKNITCMLELTQNKLKFSE